MDAVADVAAVCLLAGLLRVQLPFGVPLGVSFAAYLSLCAAGSIYTIPAGAVCGLVLDLGCTPSQVFTKVILPLSGPGILSGLTMVFVPAVSTFYISQKLGSTGTTLIGDVIESQFKTAYNPNLGAAMSLILMVLIFVCVSIMNRFGENEDEEVMAKV